MTKATKYTIRIEGDGAQAQIQDGPTAPPTARRLGKAMAVAFPGLVVTIYQVTGNVGSEPRKIARYRGEKQEEIQAVEVSGPLHE